MEIKGMQAREICSIIRVCAKSGVSELKLGDMQISFAEGSATLPDKLDGSGTIIKDDVSLGEDTSYGEQLELEGVSGDSEEDFYNTQLMIDSPEAYEESVIGEFFDSKEGRGDMHEAVGHK